VRAALVTRPRAFALPADLVREVALAADLVREVALPVVAFPAPLLLVAGMIPPCVELESVPW
jgi:hypothetical protein